MTVLEELEVRLLDVGHGNAAILRSSEIVVVDAPPGRHLTAELERTQSLKIDHLVLSHADRDHIGGAVAMLSHPSVTVGNLWFNPDAQKDTETWGDLLLLARVLHAEGRLKVRLSLSSASEPIVDTPALRLEVLHPDVEMAGRGPRVASKSSEGIATNTMSAVLRASQGTEAVVLFGGDLDHAGLERLRHLGTSVQAQVLVFPHHGGHAGGDDRDFAAKLCEIVAPRWIVFSFARNRFKNPLAAIVSGIADAAPSARMLCTQLSRRCTADSIVINPATAVATPAGADPRSPCAGTVTVSVKNGQVTVAPTRSSHLAFVADAAPTAVCVGAGLTGSA